MHQLTQLYTECFFCTYRAISRGLPNVCDATSAYSKRPNVRFAHEGEIEAPDCEAAATNCALALSPSEANAQTIAPTSLSTQLPISDLIISLLFLGRLEGRTDARR
jgi:hypothetical protein